MTEARPDIPQPADHGPTLDVTSAEAVLRRLEFAVRNKLEGLLLQF